MTSIRGRLRNAMARVPAKLSREDAEARVRRTLSKLLSVQEREISTRWVLGRLKVKIPTRPWYVDDVDAIDAYIESVAARVDATDVTHMPDEEFAEHLRRLRGEEDGRP